MTIMLAEARFMDKDRPEVMRTLGLLGSLGLMSAGCIIGGVLGGFYLDGRFGTKPVFLIVGTLSGVVGTCAMAYRWIMKHIR